MRSLSMSGIVLFICFFFISKLYWDQGYFSSHYHFKSYWLFRRTITSQLQPHCLCCTLICAPDSYPVTIMQPLREFAR